MKLKRLLAPLLIGAFVLLSLVVVVHQINQTQTPKEIK